MHIKTNKLTNKKIAKIETNNKRT